MLANLKICGVTTPATARFCADAGVGALGAVFFPKSPRYVTPQQARAMFEGLPPRVARVGVFVDLPPDEILAVAREAGLTTLQLHGDEPPADILTLQAAGYRVIKVLKATGEKLLNAAHEIPASAGILVECGAGTLPGGNGAAWDWAGAAPLADACPFALAGGLTPDNIAGALRLSRASACDVSSGVESAPGIKDHAAIRALVAALVTSRFPSTPDDFWHSHTHSRSQALTH
jgi:phosphoribosylanthranilate isomerase